jgi:SNF2 family DNA or RNA helicase
MGYKSCRLDGTTPTSKRLGICDAFNQQSDIFLMFISTRAGGLGLNLTGANIVVIYDPSWNPSYDLQAQDRAFRIGQKRDVKVGSEKRGGRREERGGR